VHGFVNCVGVIDGRLFPLAWQRFRSRV